MSHLDHVMYEHRYYGYNLTYADLLKIKEERTNMLNEFDLKDWDKIDVEAARKELKDTGVSAYLEYFFNQVELIQKKQVKQVAALFKETPNHKMY